MILVTDAIRARLLDNGVVNADTDPVPVVKFFDPSGPATWLITEMVADDQDILFGLCDLGLGHPELGTVRLSQLRAVRGRFGLGVERDIRFRPRFTLAAYSEAARLLGRITEDRHFLAQAARRLGLPDNPELPPDFAAVN
jgi:hypothetical protein